MMRKFNTYTPLNIPRKKVLIEIKGQLIEAQKLQTPLARKNQNKLYLYHRNHVYDIEEYIQLQD